MQAYNSLQREEQELCTNMDMHVLQQGAEDGEEVEIYEAYRPAKLNEGCPHPGASPDFTPAQACRLVHAGCQHFRLPKLSWWQPLLPAT